MKFAPAVALTFWGGAYLWRCADAVIPRGGLDIELPTKKGSVRLIAKTLSYDIRNRSVVAHNAALYAPSGELIARAGWINLKAPKDADPTYHIRAGEVETRLERTKDGKWKHFDLLPEKKETEQETPLDLNIESAHVEVIDRTALKPVVLHLEGKSIQANGSGKRWLIDGACRITGYGLVKGLVRVAPEVGVGFRITADGLNLAGLANASKGNIETRRIESFSRYQAESAIVSASIKGHFSPKGKLAFDLQGKVDASGLNLGGKKVGRLSFIGNANECSATGLLSGDIEGAQTSYQGFFEWASGFQMSGSAKIVSTGTGRIPKWAADYLPRELKLGKSQLSGWVSYDKAGAVSIDGNIKADEAQWSDEALKGVTAKLHVDPDQVLVSNLQGQWMNSPLQGSIYVNTAKSELRGALNVKYLNLEAASKRIHGPFVSGYANLKTILSGKLASPTIDIQSVATAKTSVYGSPKVFLGNIEFDGQYSGGYLKIRRFAAAGRNGVFVAKGTLDIDRSLMDLNVDGNGVKLAEFSPDLKGTGLFRLSIKGTPDKPVATGRVEIIGADVMGYSIPFAGGTLKWDENGVLIRDFTAVKGATFAKGYIAWNSRDLQLGGDFSISDVILSDWLGKDVSGTLSIRRAGLSGTISNPMVTLRGSGQSIVVSGVRVDSASFSIHALRNMVEVNDLQLATGPGKANVSGYLDLTGAVGVLSGKAKDLPLSRMLPDAPEALAVSGSLDGDYVAAFHGTRLDSVRSSGALNDVTVNGALIGNGPWSVTGKNGMWSASIMVGQIERYIELDIPFYDQYEDTLRGTLTAYQLDLATLHDGFKRYLPKDSPRLAAALDSLKGDVGVSASITGDQGEMSLNIDNATVEHLSMNQQDLGKISLSASRTGRKWTIGSLEWDKDKQKAAISGMIDETGAIQLDGEVSNVDNRLISSLVPDAPQITGTIDLLSFSAAGQTKNPTIQASLKASNVGLASAGAKDGDVVTTDLNISNLLVEDGLIDAEGWMFYKGIRGALKAKLPFRFPGEFPDSEPLSASLTLATNQLSAFTKYVPSVASTTEGEVTGGLTLSGTYSKPELRGNLKVAGPIVALNGIDTYLKDVLATVEIMPDEALVKFNAQADKGGKIAASASMHLSDLPSLISAPDRLLSMPLDGNVNAEGLNLHHNGNKLGAISLIADGKISIGGTVRTPVFSSSRVALKDVYGIAPTEFAEQSETERPEINPQFDIRFDVLPGARAKATNTEVYMYGSGNLTGTLYRPDIQSNFTLAKGTLRLPNARIQLQDGGSLKFSYHISQEGIGLARMDVDLRGSTNVTAVRYGDTVDRYAIDLQMRGDILEAGKLQITAQSDPPDLSQDRIMSILGQSDFFKGLAEGNQSAIASFALPTFLDPVTSALANNLGLEYLMVEYDLQKRTTLTAARTLGGGFTLMARRQLSESSYGKEVFEMKLNYRLPFNDATLRSFMLSLGSDQDRPWKFAIEYGKRF